MRLGGTAGVVGEQVYVDVEGDEEGFVFWREDVFEEARAGLLLEREDVLLAAAGVDKNSDGEREILLLGKVLDGLGLMVFGKLIADRLWCRLVLAVVFAHGEVGVDEVGGDVEMESLGGVRRGLEAALELCWRAAERRESGHPERGERVAEIEEQEREREDEDDGRAEDKIRSCFY